MALIEGGDKDDVLAGGDEDDTMFGFGNNDGLFGNKGSDLLFGGDGDDFLNGGVGADSMFGGEGADTLSYALSNDGVAVDLTFIGKVGGATKGNAEGDYFEGIENLLGSGGDDTLQGDKFGNVIDGAFGDDFLSGGAGNDTLVGSSGDDSIMGGEGKDVISGGGEFDTLYYTQSGAAITVDLLNATAKGGHAKGDTIEGVEAIVGGSSSDIIKGDDAENEFDGGGGNDQLFGRGLDDILEGGAGNDVLEGGSGGDTLDGGDGIDTASYRTSGTGVSVALAGVHIRSGDAIGDGLISIECLVGSKHDDFLGGNNDANRLTGLTGDDALIGAGGKDQIIGGRGDDTLTGGAGKDKFIYNALAEGGDTISDLVSGIDTFVFDGGAFGGLPDGPLDGDAFAANNSGKAQTAEQHFIFELDTGILRFDANGSEAGGVTVIATLTGAPAITAGDIDIT